MKVAAVAIVLFSLSSAGAWQEPSRPFVPQMKVSLLPARGMIPAHMVNGRRVYAFSIEAVDEESRVFFASAKTLLQAGDIKPVTGGKDATGLVRGTVSIDRLGRASYKAQYLREGRIILESSAELLLLPE